MAPTVRRGATAYARAIVRLRWLVVLAWVAATVAASIYLPSIGSQGASVGDLVPTNAPAARAEAIALRSFDIPVLGRVMVVQRDPRGLSTQVQERAVQRALAIDSSSTPVARRPIPGAIPVTNVLRLFPGSKEDSTTAITYLLFRPDQSVEEQVQQADRFAAGIRQPGDSLVGVTGPIPARQRQTTIILAWLPWVEAATVLVVALILGLYFRAFGAPLLTLGAAAIAYMVALHVLAWVAARAGVSVPQDVEPVLVALLLGVITDYSVFFLSGYRRRLEGGEPRVDGAVRTTANVVPIVFTAGLIVAASSAALLVARLGFLRAFGPALGLTVLVSLLVAISFVPAVMAIAGRWLFLPGRNRGAAPDATQPSRATGGAEGSAAGASPASAPPASAPRRRWWTRSTTKPVAALIAVLCLAALVAAGFGISRARLGFPLISGLPSSDRVTRAAAAARQGFAAGVLSPTEVVLRGSGFDSRLQQLGTLQAEVERLPGVAGVLGPGVPSSVRSRIGAAGAGGQAGDLIGTLTLGPDQARGLIVSDDGSTARMVVILREDPLGPSGIDILRNVEAAMPGMLRRAGLGGVQALYAGDTALADDAIRMTLSDLVRVAIAVLLISFLLLAIFLRSLVAPLYLLGASVLALAASLGLTVFVFQDLLGFEGITYYVPFAAAVLLVSLGSDYNIFVVGRIWDEAKQRPLRDAIAVAGPRAARTISVAGLVLAASFAVLALVPLVQFREFAFVMVVGILLDSFLVRSLLVPSLIALFGRVSWWPGRGPGRVAGEGESQVRRAA
jgi:putative drug exporter of the RND superfamily